MKLSIRHQQPLTPKIRSKLKVATPSHAPKPFKPYPGAQTTLWELTNPTNPEFTCAYFRAGLNSGKTFLGSAFCVRRSQQDPKARGLITANTFGQLETSTLVGLAEYCQKHDIPLTPCASSVEETARSIAHNRHCRIANTFHYVLSAEVFTGKTQRSVETGRGLQVRWIWADEYAYASKSAFEALMGRLGRGEGFTKGVFLLTSTINRNQPYNWAYDLFDDPNRSQSQKQQFRSVSGSTRENLSLDPDFIDRMQATLSPDLFTLEIESEYTSITEGIIYKFFNRDRHTLNLEYNPNYPLHLSLDFNHHPSTAIAAQLIDGELLIIKEFYLTNSNTFELSQTISNYLNELPPITKLYLHGDATGNQKTANSLQSNWQIVNQTLRSFNPIKRYGKSNPNVQDSINLVNSAFSNNSIFIDSSACELIKDLESLKYSPNGSIDKKDIQRSHLQDSLRYLAFDLLDNPYRSPLYQTSNLIY